MRRFIVAALLMLGSSQALAHGHLQSSTPAEGSVLETAPETLTLDFSEALETALSDVTLTDAQGKTLATGELAAEDGDASIVNLKLPELAPGTYRVTWQVTSIDTHRSEGEFSFQVAGDD